MKLAHPLPKNTTVFCIHCGKDIFVVTHSIKSGESITRAKVVYHNKMGKREQCPGCKERWFSEDGKVYGQRQ